MKRLIRTTILAAALAALVSQSTRASFMVNDLYLGFGQSSASSDLIIDLGQASSLLGQTSVVNLSSDLGSLTLFNSTFNNTASGVVMAVVGGNNTPPTYGVFATQLRLGVDGPGVPDSSITSTHSSSQMSGGAGQVAGLAALAGGLPGAGNSLLDSHKSFTSAIDTTGVQNNFIGKTGVNPTGTIDSSGVIKEDLWAATTSSPYTYKGFFTFDYNAGSLTFTSVAVPEPGTFSLLLAGLLAVSLRGQLRRKRA